MNLQIFTEPSYPEKAPLSLLNMLCELSIWFNKKEGVEEQFPEVRENSLYEKLWNHLDKRELRDFGSTKLILDAPILAAKFQHYNPMAKLSGTFQ